MAITQVIGFTEPYKATQQWYVGVTFSRSATGSGTGSETALWKISPCRTAIGTGVGGFDSTGLLTHIRQGSDSAGTGSSSTFRLLSRIRTASGSGSSSEVAYGSKSALRSASSSGVGSSSIVSFKTTFASAESSASGSSSSTGLRSVIKTATGEGIGSTSGDAVGYKFHMFRPPTVADVPTQLVGGDRIANRLARFFAPQSRGKNVYKLVDQTFTEVDQSNYDVIEKVYHGGHVHTLTEEEYSDLLAAGYEDYLT